MENKITLDMIVERSLTRAIKNTVNRILENECRSNQKDFDEPINWGDLSCASVEIVVLPEIEEKYYLVTIEEASSSCSKLPSYVSECLGRSYSGIQIQVVCEW